MRAPPSLRGRPPSARAASFPPHLASRPRPGEGEKRWRHAPNGPRRSEEGGAIEALAPPPGFVKKGGGGGAAPDSPPSGAPGGRAGARGRARAHADWLPAAVGARLTAAAPPSRGKTKQRRRRRGAERSAALRMPRPARGPQAGRRAPSPRPGL